MFDRVLNTPPTLREKCPYSTFSWSVFSRIWTKYFPYTLCLSVFSPNAGKCGQEKLWIWTLFTQCDTVPEIFENHSAKSVLESRFDKVESCTSRLSEDIIYTRSISMRIFQNFPNYNRFSQWNTDNKLSVNLYTSQRHILEHYQTFKIKHFAKIVICWKPLIIFTKNFILDVWQSFDYIK